MKESSYFINETTNPYRQGLGRMLFLNLLQGLLSFPLRIFRKSAAKSVIDEDYLELLRPGQESPQQSF